MRLILIILIFPAIILHANNLSALSVDQSTDMKGTLTGTIKDSEGNPIPNAIVSIQEKIFTTDQSGEFEFKDLKSGDYKLNVLVEGKGEQSFEVTIKEGENTFVDIVLSDDEYISLETATITAAKLFAEKKSEMVARLPLKNLENAQVYTVVPKELLEEQVSTDFRGALLSSPGVTNVTLGVGSGGTGLAMMMRGFSGADGAGAIRNGMATNFVSLSDPVNLERLEVIKGPSSTLFGSTLVAYGGLVNRVTKQPLPQEKAEISVTGGGYSLGRLTVDYNKPLNKEKTMLFRINTAIHREKSFQDQGINRTFMVAPAFKYFVNEKLTLNVDAEYFQTERNSTYVGLTPSAGIKNFDELDWDFKKSYATNDITSSAKVLNVFANANYKINENWTSDTRFSYSNTDNDANYLFLLVRTDTAAAYTGKKLLQRRIMNLPSNFNTVQFQQNITAIHNWGNFNNKLLIGLDYTQLQTTDSRTMVNDYDLSAWAYAGSPTSGPQLTILNEGGPVINRDTYEALLSKTQRASNFRDTQTFSGYISDVFSLFDRIHIMGGFRLDRYHDRAADYLQTAFSPKIGLVGQIIENQLSAFINYQNGFKNVAPQLDAVTQEKQVFKPEQANQFEGGFKFELLNGKINGTVSYYDINVKDKVRYILDPQDPNDRTAVQNGTQKSKGIEFDLIANPFTGLHIIFGYGYNDSRFGKSTENPDGSTLENKIPLGVPHNSANYWASYKISKGSLEGFGLGFGGNYSDGYYFDDINTVKISGFNTMDASLFYETPKFRVALKGNNLNNQEYWTAMYWSIPQQTRTIVANLTFRF